MQTSISAIILTKNEEKNITECLEQLSWCKEILVIDDESTDNTVKLARKHGAKVYVRPLEGDFSEQRNFGIEKAQEEWIFFLDADERVSAALADEIYQQTSQFLTSASGFTLKREDVMWGKKLLHGETGSIRLLRIAKKGKGSWKGHVHETWEIIGEVLPLQQPLLHYPHQDVRNFLSEINTYSTIRAHEIIAKKSSVTYLAIIVYPLSKFIINYLFRQGFRDGIPGIVHALMMSFHSFLVRSKAWSLRQAK